MPDLSALTAAHRGRRNRCHNQESLYGPGEILGVLHPDQAAHLTKYAFRLDSNLVFEVVKRATFASRI